MSPKRSSRTQPMETVSVVVVMTLLQTVLGITNLCIPQENCKLPPSGITSSFKTFDIPQLVLVTVEGNLSPALSQRLFNSNRRNPDDCPISMTTFLDPYNLDIVGTYAEIQRGMETSILGNINLTNLTEKVAYNKILEVKTDLASKIPHMQNVLGWRSRDSDQVDRNLFNSLSYIGFTYDSSLLVNRPNDESTFQWPFRMSKGWRVPPCDGNGKCQEGDFPNLWQFPMTSLYDVKYRVTCHTLANCTDLWSSDDVRDLLLNNLKRFYLGNRAPFVLKLSADWLEKDSKHVNGLDAFIKQMTLFNDIYIVSIEKAIKWLFNPTPLRELPLFKAWECPLQASSLNKPFETYPEGLNKDPVGSSNGTLDEAEVHKRLTVNWESLTRRDKVKVLFTANSAVILKHFPSTLILFWLLYYTTNDYLPRT